MRRSQRSRREVRRYPEPEMSANDDQLTGDDPNATLIDFPEDDEADWKAKYLETLKELRELKAVKGPAPSPVEFQPTRTHNPDIANNPQTGKYIVKPSVSFSHAPADYHSQPLSTIHIPSPQQRHDVWGNTTQVPPTGTHSPQVATAAASDVNFQPRPFEPRPFQPPPTLYAPRKLLDLPEFDGTPDRWAQFIKSYTYSTNTYGYSNLENHARLTKALRGVARDSVGALLIDPDHVTLAIDALQFRFGRPEILIASHMQKIRSLSAMTEDKLYDVIDFGMQVANMVAYVKAAGAGYRLKDHSLVDEMVTKLPPSIRDKWVRHAYGVLGGLINVDVALFADWISGEAKYLMLSREAGPPTTRPSKQPVRAIMAIEATGDDPESNESTTVATVGTVPAMANRQSCFVCQMEHKVADCPAFNEKSTDDRWTAVREAKCCFSCLRKGHALPLCRSKKPCGVNNCQRRHHPLLHTTENISTTAAAAVAATPTTQSVNAIKTSDDQCLYKYIMVTIEGPRGRTNTLAFIDEGSKASLIDAQLAQDLGLAGQRTNTRLSWVVGQTTEYSTKKVEFAISSADDESSTLFEIKNVMAIPDLKLNRQQFNLSAWQKIFPQLANLPVRSYEPLRPQLLLGIPHMHLIRPIQTILMGKDYAAQQTNIGWVFYGGREANDNFTVGLIDVVDNDMEEIQAIAKRHFELDSLLTHSARQRRLPEIQSDEDKRAMHILKTTTRRCSTGYETGLLWKSDTCRLPTSFPAAMNRLKCVENKMAKDADLSTWYKQKISDYIAKGYAVKLSAEEASKSIGPVWYLPHFVTANPNKDNKRRLVFDAAAKVGGVSLNSQLLRGPEHLQPRSLFNILLHFRQSAIGVCGDIREMYNRVSIIKKDQDAQRFLWRDGNPHRPADAYRMRAMIFGSRSSPCSAQYVKNVNADHHKTTQPRAVEAIRDYHYVDDYVDCFDTEAEAVDVTKSVVEINREAGFELRGLISNSGVILKELSAAGIELDLGNSSATKVLGLKWDPNSDEFEFILRLDKLPKSIRDGDARPTKSQALGIIMTIFDPFGYLANVMIRSKMIMKELWSLKIGWNEELPEELNQQFRLWIDSLKDAQPFRIPRCYDIKFSSASSQKEIHIFTDASTVAYAAVAYWRIVVGDKVHIAFIAGKCRCVPPIAPSVPRLELQSALLGTRLMRTVQEAHTIHPTRVVLWSDSKTTISWIKGGSTPDKYIGARVYDILTETKAEQWRWIPGTENPADIPTRADDRRGNDLWIHGPSFLSSPETTWPRLETVTCNAIDTAVGGWDDSALVMSKYSSYKRLKRVTGWLVRLTSAFKGRTITRRHEKGPMTRKRVKEDSKVKIIEPLTAAELDEAEIRICRLLQMKHFPEEYALLEEGKEILPQSNIFCLSPVMGDDKVIRVGSRTGNCKWIPYATRWPIILPKDDWTTNLIILHYHNEFCHQNENSQIAAIRGKFWIPAIRQVVRRATQRCQYCKNRRARPQQPIMGSLPTDRVEPFVRPFSYVGLDYAGPFYVAIGRRREKRWIALFTCLTIRAIHLEVARDLSSDAVIVCLSNFVNRRGVPVRIRSDQGTNFIGAVNEGTEMFANECANRGIEWSFNVPGNPEAGGSWERLVQSVKRVLSVSLKEEAPQIETFIAMTIEAENIVNSRPLTDLPIDSAEDDPITPNHFLLGVPNQNPTPRIGTNVCLDKQWKLKMQMSKRFWRQWINDYLPTLTRRTKWFSNARNLQVDDIVVVCDKSAGKGAWTKGRVIDVCTSPDGKIRSAWIKTATGKLHRPASKLAVLDVKASGPPQDVAVSTTVK